jgi:simple sugar transport system permease protein
MTELQERDTGADTTVAPVSRSAVSRFGGFLLAKPESTIAIAAVVLAAYFALTNDVFLSTPNIRIVSQYLVATAILATGQTMLLISGEIDLSMGNVYFMTPFLVFFAMEAGLPLPLAVLVGVLGAGVVGVVNGVITISARIMHLVLTKTRWGVYTIAIGGNKTGAKEAGVPSTRIRMGNFVMAAMLAGFAGVIEGIRIGSFDPGAGVAGQRVFASVAAAVIGGTILTGGAGTVIGAFLGALVLAILQDGFVLAGISAFTYSMVLGAAIILAMVLNSLASKARVRSQSVRL